MDDPPPTVAEEFAMALAVQLYRKGVIDADDCDAVAGMLCRAGGEAPADRRELYEAATRLAMSVPLEATAPDPADWRAGEARKRFRVIEGGEG